MTDTGSTRFLPLPNLSPQVVPAVQEFVDDPDFRVISSFFLGWVFIYSIYHVAFSPFMQEICRRLASKFGLCLDANPSDIESGLVNARSHTTGSPGEESSGMQQQHDGRALTFILNLCFVFASVMQFVSLLAFSKAGSGDTACAVVVACAGMASQCSRLVALLILCLELRRLGVGRWECWTIWSCVAVALVLVIVNNALSTGTRRVQEPYGIWHCYKHHFLPTSILSSVIHLLLESFMAGRLVTLMRSSVPLRVILSSVAMARVMSLIALDALVMVPDAISTNVLAQCVPFSLGAMVVLASFNYSALPAETSFSAAFSEKSASVVRVILSPIPPSTASAGSRPSVRIPDTHTAPHDSHDGLNVLSPAETHYSRFTMDTTMIRRVENAIVSTATRQLPTAPPESPRMPHSAPAQMLNIPPSQLYVGGPILPSQTQVARQWEREITTGPVVRPVNNRPQVTIVAEDLEPEIQDTRSSLYPQTPRSAAIGSDTLQMTPRKGKSKKFWSFQRASKSSYAYSARDLVLTSARRVSSTSSRVTRSQSTASSQDSHDVVAGVKSPASALSAPSPVRKSLRWSTMKRRSSIASSRTGPRDAAGEGQSSNLQRVSHGSRKGRRTTFGLRSPSSYKPPFTPIEPMPPIPFPLGMPESLPTMPTLVGDPARVRDPMTPRPLPPLHPVAALVALPLSPAGDNTSEQQDRSKRATRLKGPRPPPSSFPTVDEPPS